MSKNENKQLIIFGFGGLLCALPIEDVQEVILLPRLVKPPGLPAAVAGFLEIGTSLIPVLLLDQMLKLPEQTLGLYTPLLLLKDSAQPFAFPTEQVHEIASVPAEAMLPVKESESLGGCIAGAFTWKEKPVHIFSRSRLLFEKEKQALADYKAWEIQRGAVLTKAGLR